MSHVSTCVIASVAFFIFLSPAHAASFRGLSHYAPDAEQTFGEGLSSDGSIVVGWSLAPNYKSVRWLPDGTIQALGQLPGSNTSFAAETSTGGLVIVGWTETDPTAQQAFRWTESTGMQGMAPLIGNDTSRATTVSNDGSVIAGYLGAGGFRWSAADGVKILAGAPVEGMNSDGSVLVGYDANAQAYSWQNNTMTHIPFLPGGFSGIAHAVSDNGVVIGNGSSTNNPYGNNAFRWSRTTGISSLGDLPGGYFDSVAWDVSANGQIIVGSSDGGFGPAAFIWDAAHGMRELRKVLLNDYHVDPGPWTLQSAVNISADGNTILGYGLDPTGRTAPWVVSLIPEPSTMPAFALGLIFIAQRIRRRPLL